MTRKKKHIVFHEQHVTFRSADAAMFGRGQQVFQPMLAPATSQQVGELEMGQEHGAYFIRRRGHGDVRAETLPVLLKHFKQQVLTCFIQARPDLVWLHAGAVASGGKAVLLIGPWGSGKSTLAAQLCKRGWHYLSDDIAPLDPVSSRVHPFPLKPVRRKEAGRRLPREHVSMLQKEEVSLHPDAVCRKAVPVKAVVFPAFSPEGENTMRPRSPSRAALECVNHCLNFEAHEGKALKYLCDLAGRVPVFHLRYREGTSAAELVAGIGKGKDSSMLPPIDFYPDQPKQILDEVHYD